MFHNKACAKVMPPYMPVATHAVIRLPVGFIPGKLVVPGFGNSCQFRHVSSGSLTLISLTPTKRGISTLLPHSLTTTPFGRSSSGRFEAPF